MDGLTMAHGSNGYERNSAFQKILTYTFMKYVALIASHYEDFKGNLTIMDCGCSQHRWARSGSLGGRVKF